MKDIHLGIINTMLVDNRGPVEDLNRLDETMVTKGVEMDTNDRDHTTEGIKAISLS